LNPTFRVGVFIFVVLYCFCRVFYELHLRHGGDVRYYRCHKCNCRAKPIKAPLLEQILDKCEGYISSMCYNRKTKAWTLHIEIYNEKKFKDNNWIENKDLKSAALQALMWAKHGLILDKDNQWRKE